MQVPARLNWHKSENGFRAYPVGALQPHRFAEIGPNIGRHGSWSWTVMWDGWFNQDGTCQGKQEAADAATEAWWRLVQTDIPRDTETEIAVIAARVLVMPPPNSLYSESADFLRALMQTLRMQYEADMRAERVPRPVSDLMGNLSAELFRRRLNGESEDGAGYRWGVL